MSDETNKVGEGTENPIASLKPRSKPKERALPFSMDQILAVKEDVASGQWKSPDEASGRSARPQETADPPATPPEPRDGQSPAEAATDQPAPRHAIAPRASKTRTPAVTEERPLLKRDLVKVHVRMTREERDELHIHARRNGKSVQTLLEDFVRKTLKDINRAR